MWAESEKICDSFHDLSFDMISGVESEDLKEKYHESAGACMATYDIMNAAGFM